MSATTTTEIDSAINNYYDKKLLKKAIPRFVYQNWAQTRDIPRNNSNVIKFRRYSLLASATTPLSEGVTPSGSQLSKTDLTAQVDSYGDYVTLTDVLVFTTLDPVLSETAGVLGIQYAQTLDELARDVLAAGTTIQYASTATATNEITSSMKITKAEIQEAVRTLKINEAQKITEMISAGSGFDTTPVAAAYIAICDANTTYDLKNIPGFIPVEQYGQKKALPGEVGSLDEVRFIETTQAKVFSGAGSGSIDVHATIILGADAYARTRISGEAVHNIVKPLGSAGSADPLNQRQTSGWKATYVTTRLNESWMLRLEHATS